MKTEGLHSPLQSKRPGNLREREGESKNIPQDLTGANCFLTANSYDSPHHSHLNTDKGFGNIINRLKFGLSNPSSAKLCKKKNNFRKVFYIFILTTTLTLL